MDKLEKYDKSRHVLVRNYKCIYSNLSKFTFKENLNALLTVYFPFPILFCLFHWKPNHDGLWRLLPLGQLPLIPFVLCLDFSWEILIPDLLDPDCPIFVVGQWISNHRASVLYNPVHRRLHRGYRLVDHGISLFDHLKNRWIFGEKHKWLI